MERLECFCVLIHVICIVRVVLLHLLKTQDISFSHTAHASLRTNLTHAALFEHVKKDHSYMLSIYESRQLCHQVVPDFSIGDRNLMETGGCHSGRN